MEDWEDNEYGMYEDDYKTFEDNCAWEDAMSDMEWDRGYASGDYDSPDYDY